MDNNHLFKKVRSLDRDMDRIYSLTSRNADVFNRFSGEVKRRLDRIEKSNRKWHFIVFGLLLEDIVTRYRIYQKISNSEKNDPENEENSEK
ncbi:MAG: hypothetical protein J6U54_17685 [Clostridiales bacterium]|nr:hypothetical protein [Clostridiales bacterium]